MEFLLSIYSQEDLSNKKDKSSFLQVVSDAVRVLAHRTDTNQGAEDGDARNQPRRPIAIRDGNKGDRLPQDSEGKTEANTDGATDGMILRQESKPPYPCA
jgi:hypothetical protein